MRKSKKRVFLALFLIFVQLVGTLPIQAAVYLTGNEIRVGLTSLYSGKEKLTIYNSKLGYGYSVNQKYLQEAVLESSSGFTFEPISGYFIAEQKAYGSYQAAKQAAEYYRAQGIEAYPGSVYQCSWKVYLSNTIKYSEAEALLQMLQELFPESSFEILSGNNYRVLVTGSFGKLLMDVDEHYAYPQFRPVTIYEKGVYCVNMGSRVYRGRMEIGRYNQSGLTAVNVVDLEEYLYGVVPSEMPSAWHIEAIKAQAVCSRSYALIKAGLGGSSNAKKGYKIVDTVSSQVYKGYLAESVKVNQAVDATRGEMVCYQNKVIPAYFFSTSGGRTEASKDVWAADLPYLQSVTDFYEYGSGHELWQVTMTMEDISAALTGMGSSMRELKEVWISERSSTGRVYALTFLGANRTLTLQGTSIRNALNLESTKFKIVRKGETPDEVCVLSAEGMASRRISDSYVASAEGVKKVSDTIEQYVVQGSQDRSNYPRTAPDMADEILFAGMGYGHGVGMSQYGAKGMAEAGYSYKKIIEYYFTGAYVK